MFQLFSLPLWIIFHQDFPEHLAHVFQPLRITLTMCSWSEMTLTTFERDNRVSKSGHMERNLTRSLVVGHLGCCPERCLVKEKGSLFPGLVIALMRPFCLWHSPCISCFWRYPISKDCLLTFLISPPPVEHRTAPFLPWQRQKMKQMVMGQGNKVYMIRWREK